MTEVERLINSFVRRHTYGQPYIAAQCFETPAGTPYLREPGVFMIARPEISLAGVDEFFCDFDESLGFTGYIDDPTQIEPGAQLVKFAGQACYASFGPKRTMNDQAGRYFANIIGSGHGSVLEHANYSFFLHGISRSNTHEIVRHRAGFGYSQLSQRYVSGRVLRFVERPEYVDDPLLHSQFVERIDRATQEYAAITEHLQAQQDAGSSQLLSAEAKTDLRKKVQQTARSVLPNETETWMVMTGNARSWRHFVEMRASEHAEVEIRRLAFYIFLCLRQAEPILFGDYSVEKLVDGTFIVTTPNRKV